VAAAPLPRPRLTHAAVNYRPRIVGFSLFALMLLAVPAHESLRLRVALMVLCIAWPHVAFLLTRRGGDQRRAEVANILLDSLIGGCIAAGYALRLWPTTAMFSIGVINGLLYGGPRFTVLGASVWAATLATVLVLFDIAPHLDTEPLGTALGVLGIVAYISVVGMTAYGLRRRQRETRAALEREEAKSRALLLNVFPASVVPRLRGGESLIADEFADVTVVFADMVEFTPLAERLGPRRTVLLLNDLFRRFDEAAQKFGVEKIETTGDGYLAVAGAPTPLDAHAEAAADFALALVEATQRLESADRVAIRVGLHTGPVYGGVVGESRFHYKIFGETVNVASRIQGHSQPGRILLSEATCKRIQSSHVLEEYGTAELKGHGPMRTYWLVSRIGE
jgi:class 3 adenylate cyclase